jgi:hypothetical protein
VKNRFQSLPFKCNLQRYITGQQYTPAVDMWASGVVMYAMMVWLYKRVEIS